MLVVVTGVEGSGCRELSETLTSAVDFPEELSQTVEAVNEDLREGIYHNASHTGIRVDALVRELQTKNRYVAVCSEGFAEFAGFWNLALHRPRYIVMISTIERMLSPMINKGIEPLAAERALTRRYKNLDCISHDLRLIVHTSSFSSGAWASENEIRRIGKFLDIIPLYEKTVMKMATSMTRFMSSRRLMSTNSPYLPATAVMYNAYCVESERDIL